MRLMIWYASLLAVAVVAMSAPAAQAGRPAQQRCGCSDPYVAYTSNITPTPMASATQRDCLTGAWTELQVVLVPTTVTEKRTVCSTGYKEEERSRVITGYKMVPITEERVRLTTVSTPRTETKMINYTTQVAMQSEE